MDELQEFHVSNLAHAINEYVRNREFGFAHETISESIEQWKEKFNFELLCAEAQIMVELMSYERVFSGLLTR